MSKFKNVRTGLAEIIAKKSPEQKGIRKAVVNDKLTIEQIKKSPVFTNPEKWMNKRRVLDSSQRIESYPNLEADLLAKKLASPTRRNRSTMLSFPREYMLGFTSVKDPESTNDEAKLAPSFEHQLSKGTKYSALDHLSVSHLRFMKENEVVPSFLVHERFKNDNLASQKMLVGSDMILYLKYLNELKRALKDLSESKHEFSSDPLIKESKPNFENITILSFKTPTIRSIFLSVDPYAQNTIRPALNVPYILHNEGKLYAKIKEFFLSKENSYELMNENKESLVIIKDTTMKELRFVECLSRYAFYEERILFEQTSSL